MFTEINVNQYIYSLTTEECFSNGFDFNATEFGCEYAVSLHKNGVPFSSAIKAGIMVAEKHHHTNLTINN